MQGVTVARPCGQSVIGRDVLWRRYTQFDLIGPNRSENAAHDRAMSRS
jgi:hypothetical protein